MVSTPSSLSLLLSLLALLLCLRLFLCWLPFPLLWVCGSRVGLCSGGLSWVGLSSGSSAFLLSLSLPPVLRFCHGPSPYPLGSAASPHLMASQGFGPLLLAPRPGCWVSLSFRLFPRSPYLSLLFVPLPLLHLSRPFGFCFCGSFRSSLVASAASVEVFSSPSSRHCWASASPLALLWGSGSAPAPSSALEPSSGGFPVGGLVAPCACCPYVLRAVCDFQARGVLTTCLLLTGAPGLGSFSFSSAPISLCSP